MKTDQEMIKYTVAFMTVVFGSALLDGVWCAIKSVFSRRGKKNETD
jgi:hypothetical protein